MPVRDGPRRKPKWKRVSKPGDGEEVLAMKERVARKGEATRGSEELKKPELECRGGLEEQETVRVSVRKGLQVLVPRISRGRVLVLIARSPKFDVYQPPAVADISGEILDET